MKKFQAVCQSGDFKRKPTSSEEQAQSDKDEHLSDKPDHRVDIIETVSGNFSIGNTVTLEQKHSNLPIESVGEIISGPFVQKKETILYVNFKNDSRKFRKVPKNKLFCYGEVKPLYDF